MAQLPERSRFCVNVSPVWRRWLAHLLAFAASTGLAHAGTWIPIGPNDVAMVSAISVGKSAVYAATCNGVYRSDDGGASWREAGLQRECVARLAADPRSDTVYAIADHNTYVSATPEPSRLLGSFFLALGSTTWVSRDGARSWSQMPIFNGTSIAVDPTEPETAYVASYDLVAVTHDSGSTWTRVAEAPSNTYIQLVVDPRDGVVYAVGTGVIAVGDGGAWTEIPLSTDAIGVGSDSVGTVYAAGFQSFCRKTTSAPDWACGAQVWSTPVDVLEIPATISEGPKILVVAFDGVWASADGGTSWSLAVGDPAGYTPAIALDPASSVVYAGNDVGVYRSADRGQTWTSSSSALRSSWIRALAIDPADASTIWAGGEGRVRDLDQPVPGLFRSRDAGDSWSRVSEDGEPGYVFSLEVSPADPRSIYVGAFESVARSSDGGASWSKHGTSAPGTRCWECGFVHDVAVDPDSASNVWAATGDGLKTSTNGGVTWSDGLTSSVYSLLFDSRRPGTLYAGSSWEDASFYYPFGFGFAVHTSRDNGATWSRAGNEGEGGVISLAIDPFSQDAVYAGTFAATILRSPDAGATWERWDRESPGYWVLALVADPVRSGTLYQAGWGGVFRSTDGGRTWHDFSVGLSPYGVFGLAVSRDGTYLYAGTTGGGVFRRNLLVEDRQPVTTIDRPRTTRTVPP